MRMCEYRAVQIQGGEDGGAPLYEVQSVCHGEIRRIGRPNKSMVWMERFARLLTRYEVDPADAERVAADFFMKSRMSRWVSAALPGI